jgi:hypothetical protein
VSGRDAVGTAGVAGAPQATIVSAIHNFLGTYTSRYSSYDRFWLFGFLVAPTLELDAPLQVELMAADGSTDAPLTPARRAATLARARWGEQLAKARVARALVAQAALTLRVASEHGRVILPEDGREAVALAFEVVVVAASGRVYRGARTVWVAPHDPSRERRSGRPDEP